MTSTIARLGLFLVLISNILVACNTPPDGTLETLTPDITEIPTDTLTPTDLPTQTATTQPPLVVLVASPQSNTAQLDSLQATLSELSNAAGLRFQIRSSLTTEDLTPDIQLVVIMAPDPGVAALAASAPETQFVAVDILGLEAAGNLSVIGPEGATPDQLGFLVGYLAAVITTDWRVGTINTNDSPAGIGSRNGFLNGVVYFCGLCNPAYPPYNDYPLYVELYSAASSNEWQLAADMIRDNAVETVFVSRGADGDELLSYLAESGINIIGNTPPPEGTRSNWIATVYPDPSPAMAQLWPELLSGNGGFRLPMDILISDINISLFSPGRQRLVDQVRLDLYHGYIDTGVDSSTGENK
jgi:hypothetical protein